MDVNALIADFLAGDVYAVVGASRDRAKYGNKVLRCYLQDGRRALPVHPFEREIEGQRTWPDLASLPETPHGISIITQPAVSAEVIDQALELGLRRLWLQPGAEDAEAIERAREKGASVIAYGPCLLVALRYRE